MIELVQIHEEVAALVRPSAGPACRVVAVNSGRVADPAEARGRIDAIATEAGLPADHPQRFGAGRMSAAVRTALEA